jgi:cell division ATPase FtsA
MEDGHTISDEDIYNLDSKAVEQAYQIFLDSNKDSALKFYLVGYSVLHYYLNDYQIANLEGHNAGKLRVDLIATFLPDDVVDGLYKACERAELAVANLTLEPIAAIMVAIPEKFRLLNLALIDVGAGTSDICVTKEGTITAYGMIPVAGDHLTEKIAQHCLVDFNTADRIKVDAQFMDKVTYTDIMGLEKTITEREVNDTLRPLVTSMAADVTAEIRRLNGDQPVSAVFIVGGGGCVQGYTTEIAKDMGIPEERVALRGSEVMNDLNSLPVKDRPGIL